MIQPDETWKKITKQTLHKLEAAIEKELNKRRKITNVETIDVQTQD